MRYTEIDRRIECACRRQFGVFSRQQAFDLGASERFVQATPAGQALASSGSGGVRRSPAAQGPGSASARSPSCRSTTRRSPGWRLRRCTSCRGSGRAAIELLAPVNSYCSAPVRDGAPLRRRGAHRRSTAFVSRRSPRRCSTSLHESASWRLERAIDDCLARQDDHRGRPRRTARVLRRSAPTGPTDDPTARARALEARLDATRERARGDARGSARARCRAARRSFVRPRCRGGRSRARAGRLPAAGPSADHRSRRSALARPVSRTSTATGGATTRPSPTGTASCASRGSTSPNSPMTSLDVINRTIVPRAAVAS